MDPSLFATIMGGGDQTPDANTGLTNADRSNIGFQGIGQLGALLMAAGAPSWDGGAKYLAQIGNVAGNMGEAKDSAINRKRLNQKLVQEQRSNAAAAELQEAGKNLDMSGLSAQQQQLIKPAYASGDMAKIIAAQQAITAMQKESREASQPIPLGNGMFWDRGTNTAINPITGMKFELGSNGQVGPGVHMATGKPVSEDDNLTDDDGFRSGYLQNAVPKQFHEQVKAIAEGRQKLPSGGGRDAGLNAQLINWARQYNPNLDQTTYSERDKASKDYAPSGAVGKTIISLNTLLSHAQELRNNAKELNNSSIPIWNSAKNTFDTVTGGSAPAKFDQTRGIVSRELDNLLSGGRVTLAETDEIRKNLNSAQSPEQLQAIIDGIVHLAEPRLQAATQKGQMSLGKKGMQTIGEQLNNPKGFAAVEDLKANPLPGSKRYEAMKAGQGGQAAPPAGGAQPALPPGADTNKYDYRYDAARNTWQRKPK